MVSETLVIVNVDVGCFVCALEELAVADSVSENPKTSPRELDKAVKGDIWRSYLLYINGVKS